MEARRQNPFTWHAQHKTIMYNNRRISGLCKHLHVFYPHYKFKQVKNGRFRRAKPAALHQARGLNRGKIVDREVSLCARLLGRYRSNGFTIRQLLTKNAKLPGDVTDQDKQDILLLRNRAHPYTRKVLYALAELRLQLLDSQVLVGDADLGIATFVDLVAVNATGQRVLIELKTGFMGYYDRDSGHKMEAPFQELTDCPRNQHQLQLLGGYLFYNTCHPEQPLAVPLLLRVHEAGVDLTRLNPVMLVHKLQFRQILYKIKHP